MTPSDTWKNANLPFSGAYPVNIGPHNRGGNDQGSWWQNTSGGGYTAKAVHFDGATYLTNSSFVAPTTSLFSLVFWFKTTQNAGEPTFFVVDPDTNVVPYITLPTGVLDIEVASSTNAFEINTSPTTFRDGVWHSVVFSVDGSTGSPRKWKLYVDDASVSNTGNPQGDAGPGALVIPGNGMKAQIGYDDTGAGGFYLGDLADYRIFYGVSLLNGAGDIPVATRRLFVDSHGKPVDPATATSSLGNATILMSGNHTSFGTNQGTGGSFTATGALTDASTHP